MAFIDRKLAQRAKLGHKVYSGVLVVYSIVYLIKIVLVRSFGYSAKVEFVCSPRDLRRFRARCHGSKMVEGGALLGGYGVCSVQTTTKNWRARRPVRPEYINCLVVGALRQIVLEVVKFMRPTFCACALL